MVTRMSEEQRVVVEGSILTLNVAWMHPYVRDGEGREREMRKGGRKGI